MPNLPKRERKTEGIPTLNLRKEGLGIVDHKRRYELGELLFDRSGEEARAGLSVPGSSMRMISLEPIYRVNPGFFVVYTCAPSRCFPTHVHRER